MPSRPLTPPPPLPTHHHHPHFHPLILPITLSFFIILIFIILIYLFLRRYRHRRLHSPTLLPFSPPHLPLTPFPFSQLRSATDSFHPSRLLGRGASASVFRGLLPTGKSVAIKLILSSSSLSSSSAAADFHNELSVLSSIKPNPFLISLLGYCCRRRRHKLLLVYEFMCNGSLQEALFIDTNNNKNTTLSWDRRYQIIIDVAEGLDYLHSHCHPPVVHGDIKPSNVLLGPDFRAKIADFGLARFKTSSPPPDPDPMPVSVSADFFSQDLTGTSPVVDFDFCNAVRSSSGLTASCRDLERKMRPNPIAVMDEDEAFGDMVFKSPPTDEQCGKDWWWKQDKVGEVSSRDYYVRDWIGSQICRSASSANMVWEEEEEEDTKTSNKEDVRIEESDDKVNHVEEKKKKKKKKDVKVREWWKEEYFAEMSKKSQSSKGLNWFQKSSSSNNNINDRELNAYGSSRKSWKINKKKRSKSTGSDMFSGDLFSRELSSTTTSMRGTIGYVAP